MAKKVLLYSGGMDSYIINALWKPDVRLFVNVGTPAAAIEEARVKEQVKAGLIGEVKFETFNLGKYEDKKTFALPLRNMFLIALASYYGDVVVLGSTAEDVFLDGSERFMRSMEFALKIAWQTQLGIDGKTVKVDTAFKELDKRNLVNLYASLGDKRKRLYDLAINTMSCYQPEYFGVADDYMECMNCMSCLRKYASLVAEGYELTNLQQFGLSMYIQREMIVERLNSGELIQPKWFKKAVLDILG